MVMDQTSVENKQTKKIILKKIGLSNGQKVNELRLWDGKKIICIHKKCSETIILPWDCFRHKD